MNFKIIPKLEKWLESNNQVIITDIPGIKVPTNNSKIFLFKFAFWPILHNKSNEGAL